MTHEVPTDRVLSTLNRDGTRNWIRPKLAHGRFLRHRRIVGYALVALFVLLPRLRIAGRPGVLIGLDTGEIDVLGAVFRPSDGFVLALLGVTIVAGVFLLTALWGRVWCGWGCPQTVYLEHVFRPIERWLEGSRGQRASRTRKAIKWALFTAVAFALSNVFLAYFVGTERLERWVFESPLDHPGGFALVVGVAALMLFDFGWFREQMCIVACTYGRLQSVLLDRQSLIIGYDTQRGEPRNQPKKKLPVVSSGDCVDCAACVAVCPTGIDIRDGLQMECIGCAQCIDACDTVMTKLGRPQGLIRYTSQDALAGKRARMLRARTIAYPAMLLLAGGLGESGQMKGQLRTHRVEGLGEAADLVAPAYLRQREIQLAAGDVLGPTGEHRQRRQRAPGHQQDHQRDTQHRQQPQDQFARHQLAQAALHERLRHLQTQRPGGAVDGCAVDPRWLGNVGQSAHGQCLRLRRGIAQRGDQCGRGRLAEQCCAVMGQEMLLGIHHE